jgi:hypothetical protein
LEICIFNVDLKVQTYQQILVILYFPTRFMISKLFGQAISFGFSYDICKKLGVEVYSRNRTFREFGDCAYLIYNLPIFEKK